LFAGVLFAEYAIGFLYLRDERLDPVTNRHAPAGDNLQPRADSASVRLHITANVYDNHDFQIGLVADDGSPVWRAAPSSADIAVIPLDRGSLVKASYSNWFTHA